MTRWERCYRWMGGKGPEDDDTSLRCWMGIRDGFEDFWPHWPGKVANTLKVLGFLSRDPNLPSPLSGYYVNFRWQWRFWRGPYYDCMRQQGFVCRFVLGWPPLEWWKDTWKATR